MSALASTSADFKAVQSHMSDNTHPTIRLDSQSEEDLTFSEGLGFQPSYSSKFGFTWPGEGGQKSADLLDSTPRQDSFHDHLSVTVTSTSEEPESPRDAELNQELRGLGPSDTSRSSSHIGASLPRLSRAFSMPSTSQIGHWQHPSRSPHSADTPAHSPLDECHSPADRHFQGLALELADSVQIAIQTLLQLSPPHLFDPAKEQFSACAVQIPTTSLSALLTSMKTLNYISANMRVLGSPLYEGALGLGANRLDSMVKDEFDIGEVLQSVGDSLGGVTAEAEVDLVLHHGDVIRHMGLRGDECGVSYALTHIIHQVLMTARPGDTIEVGLAISGQHTSGGGSDHPSDSTPSSSQSSVSGESPTRVTEAPVVCTFDIGHKYSSLSALPDDSFSDSRPLEDSSETRLSESAEARSEPQFDSLILRRLLKLIGGTLRTSLQPKTFPRGRRCELSIVLERGPSLSVLNGRTPSSDEETYRQPFSDIPLAHEPSIDELASFVETLRGRKVAFYASSQGSFAQHLTRYLTAWGMDISHVPTDGIEEQDPAEGTANTHAQYGSMASPPGVGASISNGETVVPIADSASDGSSESKPISSENGLSLIIIDDDVQGLRRQLLQQRAETIPNVQRHSRNRPSLASQHRPRSSPSIRNTLLTAGAAPSQKQPSPPSAFTPVPIVHFTSLANYKLVKDTIQGMILGYTSLPLIPEVIIIPKPAGPRRILTALHTAIHKPFVDPFFSPIATSPMSPGSTLPPFLSGRKSTSVSTPPSGFRSGLERQTRAGSDSAATLAPPSPLSIPERVEYFSESSVKALGGNAASGLVIQSPDGRPAGIFFQPQSRMPTSRSELTMTTMDRERITTRPVSQRISRRTTSRNPTVNGGAIETSNEATSRHRSPSTKPLLDVALGRLSFSSASSPSSNQPRHGEETDLQRSSRGKGRAGVTTVDQEECHVLTSAAWREATQTLAKLPSTPVAPLNSNPVSTTSTSVTQSPVTDGTSLSPTRLLSNTGSSAPMSRSATSPTSSESKKTARRATQGPRSPVVSTGMKKSKTVGSNIVPPISVLIVEDNAINQTILSTFMRRNKIKYEVAWNGREAVEKWRNGNFHLILMDIQMPVMDGIEATKEIRRLEKAESIGHFPSSPGESSKRSAETPDSRPSSTASTPFRSQVIIVALTASSLQSDRVAALAAGCNDFLTKPVTNSWLNDKIIEWGSIKALQMWAELRPDVAKNISRDQAVQAQAIANKLHVPLGSARNSPFGSPLRDTHILPLADAELPTNEDMANRGRMYRNTSSTGAKTARRHSNGSFSSDSSPERWPVSSDDDFTQDPITEPPAVIVTPVRGAVELPPLENEPVQVTDEEALQHYLEDSKLSSQQPPTSTLMGHRAISSATSATSITAILHDVPGVGNSKTADVAVAKHCLDTPSPAGGDVSVAKHCPDIPSPAEDGTAGH